MVKILTKLLSREEGEHGNKKNLSDMTLEELDREQKEQHIRLTRLQCDQVQLKNDNIRAKAKREASIASSMETIAKAVDNFAHKFHSQQSQPTFVYSESIVADPENADPESADPETPGPSNRET